MSEFPEVIDELAAVFLDTIRPPHREGDRFFPLSATEARNQSIEVSAGLVSVVVELLCEILDVNTEALCKGLKAGIVEVRELIVNSGPLTATGEHLDAIGRARRCDRLPTETDSDYRLRIVALPLE